MDRRNKHRRLRPQGLERWVVNLTDRSVSKPQEDVLKLGLNFAPAPTKLPVVDTIAAVEEGARQLSEEDAEDLRGRVCGILRHAKPLIEEQPDQGAEEGPGGAEKPGG